MNVAAAIRSIAALIKPAMLIAITTSITSKRKRRFASQDDWAVAELDEFRTDRFGTHYPAATQHHNRQRYPREAERLYETQDEFASVVHDDEVVEVVEVEGGEAEERDDARLEEAVLLVQLVVGVNPAQTHVRRRHHRQEDEQRLGDDQQQRPKV